MASQTRQRRLRCGEHCGGDVVAADGPVLSETAKEQERHGLQNYFADPFRRAKSGPGAEKDAGLKDVDGRVAEGGDVALEFALNPQVSVRGFRVGAD